MVTPNKKIREVLFSIHPISYRIRTKGLDKKAMDKKLFIEIVAQLKKIDERRDFMHEEIGMDMTQYEDQFFAVIENLMKMCFNKQQLGLIQTYLYTLIPDKTWDGKITVEVGANKEEKVLNFKTAEDVWTVLQRFKDK
jgi:hypothetical protein